MQPVLFSVFGLDIQSYGVSKALASLVAALLLARAFERLNLKRDSAYSLVMWGDDLGFRRRQGLVPDRTPADLTPRDKAMTVRPSA